jgi:DNA-binding transcriptional MerR regulator
MYSIGQMSARTGVKVPTIRYYEGMGLLAASGRTGGNQRRYGAAELEQLGFIKHGRDLRFSLEAIGSLIALQADPDRSCAEAGDIARIQLEAVRHKIARLTALEGELARITSVCAGDGRVGGCAVMASLADHGACAGAH